MGLEFVLSEKGKRKLSYEGFLFVRNYGDLWKLLSAIQRDEAINEVEREQMVSEENGFRIKKKCKDCASRLRHLVWDSMQIPINSTILGGLQKILLYKFCYYCILE